ncbi:hypothetical protein RB594_008949 [Gaeumannomyces avenae]
MLIKGEDFPLRHFPSEKIFPVGVMPGSPALVFAAQANFVEGGLVLTVGIHHAAGDAVALQTILSTWAENTAAAEGGDSGAFTVCDTESNDRSILMDDVPPSEDTAVSFPEYVLSPTPKAEAAAAAAAMASFQMPPMEMCLFRFMPAGLARLKAEAAAFSTHDALSAMLWRAITRARTGGDTPAPIDSAFAYVINVRPRASPPLPATYVGNASMLGLTRRLSGVEICGPGGLALTAGAIWVSLTARFPDAKQDGTAATDADGPDRVVRAIGLLGSRRDPTGYKMAYRAFLGPDVVATS